MRFLLLLLLINTFLLTGQKPDDKIDIYSFDQNFFESLIKTGIDSVRKSYRLKTLNNDTFCYLAALDQAYHLVDDTIFDHFRKNMPEKESPLKRVHFYGGKNSVVSENLAKIYINKVITYERKGYGPQKFFMTSYKEAADFLISAWVESSTHFLNIISRDFSLTGIAAIYNEEDNSLICAQVFANDTSSYAIEDYSDTSSLNLQKTNNPWGIEYSGSIKEADEDFNNAFLTSIILKNNQVFLNLSPDKWQNIIIEKNDGFAIHFVPESKYDCSGKWYYTNRDTHEEKSGITTKPIYKNQIYKQFNPSDSGNFILFIGSVPEGYFEPYEFNILILKNNVVSDVINTNHLCGENIDIKVEIPIIKPDIQNYNYVPLEEYSVYGTDTKMAALKEYTDLFVYLSQLYPYTTNHHVLERITSRLDTIQNFLFNSYLKGEITFDLIDSLPVILPENNYFSKRKYYNAIYNKLLFKHLYLPNEENNVLLSEILDNNKKSEDPSLSGLYNYYAFKIANKQYDFSLSELKTSLEKMKFKIDTNYYNQLNLYYYFQYLHQKNSILYDEETSAAMDFIYNYYKKNIVSVGERLDAAKLLIYYKKFEYAYEILSPAVDQNFTNKEACILDLQLYYSGKLQGQIYNQYFKKILDSANYLTNEEWLGLFKGSCRLNLQLLNYEPLWNLYCSKSK